MKNYISNKYNLNDKDFISVIDELPFWSAPFGIKLLDTINIKKNINALDIGFGFGFPILEIAQRLGNTSTVYGIDPWAEAIDRTNLKINNYGIENVKLVKGIAEELPFEEKFFNLIVSNNGINNVQNIPKVFKEIHRVALPGAQFVFTMNLDNTMLEFYDIYKEVLMEYSLHDEINKLMEHIYIKRRPLDEIEKMLNEAGFDINQILHNSFSYRYADGSAMLNHFFIKIAFLESWMKILPEKFS